MNASPRVVPAEQSPSGTEVIFDSNWVASPLHDLPMIATTQTRLPLLVAAITMIGAVAVVVFLTSRPRRTDVERQAAEFSERL